MPGAEKIGSGDRSGSVGTEVDRSSHQPVSPSTSKSSKGKHIHVSPEIIEAAQMAGEDLFVKLQTSPGGLTQAAAEERARQVGLNEIAQDKPQTWPVRLLEIARNPLVILLATLSQRSRSPPVTRVRER